MISLRELDRALLARQFLLRRARLDVQTAVDDAPVQEGQRIVRFVEPDARYHAVDLRR